MVHLNQQAMSKIAPLFDSHNDTLIWSCLQGHMGNAWADNAENPKSAQIITGDFCFFSGVPNTELVKNISKSFILIVPQTEEWEKLIEQEYNNNCRRFMRYAIKKEPDVFDKENLSSYSKKLPPEYTVKQIDEELYHTLLSEEWSKDFCSQFCSYTDYEKRGLGFVILYQDKPIAGASSYTVYDKGIEIEIHTKPEYRRKGLALASASALILECLNRGIYPSWDAANKESVALAEKLGYHFDKEYVTYSVRIGMGE